MGNKVWLIGGTSDSAIIANILASSNIPSIITVATETARALYSNTAEIVVGCQDTAKMLSFCQQNSFKAAIDASHPYATEVSRQAIAVTTQLNIPYLRYERDRYQLAARPHNSTVIELDNFDELLTGDYLTNQRVLLTVGCKVLPQFQPWQNKAILFARVLPKIQSLSTALASGFTNDRLIAIRPPMSMAAETALWLQWRISLVVTKASGKAGGEDIKRQVAASLGICLIVITRPEVIYPRQTSELADILNFCQQHYGR